MADDHSRSGDPFSAALWPGAGLIDPAKIQPPDVRGLAERLPAIIASAQRLLQLYARRVAGGDHADVESLSILVEPLLTLARELWNDPQRVVQQQIRLWHDSMALMNATARRMMGQEVEPIIEPAPRDRRFRDPAWVENVVFDFVKQAYLLVARAVEDTVRSPGGSRYDAGHKAAFYTRQFVEALSPSNFALTNPEVIRKTLETGGDNLIRGLENLLADLERGGGRLRLTIADRSAFELGDSIACTPGQVVYQNDLMQLIQYAPTTEQVFERPVLLVPPWINRYYVLDLQPENSFVKWLVDEGFTVFMISWVNPDERHRHKDFQDYVAEGPLAALDAIERATGARQVNAVAYCIGGTLLAATLAHLAARKRAPGGDGRGPDGADPPAGADRVASATLFTSLIDFTEVGELGMFIGEKELEVLDRAMERKGFFESQQMLEAFNMLRSSDLIWSFVIKNYLLASDPAPFDMMYWAGDNTRMPARMHGYYLRNMYLHNKLREPGALTMLGTPLDIGQISIPAYFLSTRSDHIAPWKGTYDGAIQLGGPVTFTLGGSGHIAGVINPVGSGKYGYWTNPELPPDPDAWLAGAEPHDGSWWPHWRAWIAAHAGSRVPARAPGDGELEPIEAAPGSYVRAGQ